VRLLLWLVFILERTGTLACCKPATVIHTVGVLDCQSARIANNHALDGKYMHAATHVNPSGHLLPQFSPSMQTHLTLSAGAAAWTCSGMSVSESSCNKVPGGVYAAAGTAVATLYPGCAAGCTCCQPAAAAKLGKLCKLTYVVMTTSIMFGVEQDIGDRYGCYDREV
jgi:hypothetical protein